MGTTLTNGVYLPDEGERNCYAGLKTNWEILDQKVADITALQQAVAGALHREIVESLPTTDIDLHTIYMVLSGTSATENVYNEYMYVNNAWELIGTSATDLTNYYTKAEVDGKLLLKANASDLTSHTGDSTIHVTANDKTKWTNSANTHVLRLAKSALTPSSSTNAFSNLDDSTALKVGDKVMDTAGVLFEVTAIDTANSTFTIGTALIDLAQDSDVVHKSGDEVITGFKAFENIRLTNSIKAISLENQTIDLNNCYSAFGNPSSGNISFYFCNTNDGTSNISNLPEQKAFFLISQSIRILSGGSVVYAKQILVNSNGKTFVRYCNNSVWGSWQDVTNLVTTDTAQTISGDKNFQGLLTTIPGSSLWPSVSNTTDDITLLDKHVIHVEQFGSGRLTDLSGGAWNVVELGTGCFFFRLNNGTDIRYKHLETGVVSRIPVVSGSNRFINNLTPDQDNTYSLGDSTRRWSTINGINPGSLSLPDLSNGIDISSYITVVANANKESLYTPPANGWVSVALTRTGGANMAVMLKQGNFASSGHNIAQENGTTTCSAMLPVKGGVQVSINSALADGIAFAYFYPCLGNV